MEDPPQTPGATTVAAPEGTPVAVPEMAPAVTPPPAHLAVTPVPARRASDAPRPAPGRHREGERRTRERLHLLGDVEVVVLTDRRLPGARARIDCIAVAPSGVHVIDVRRQKGLVHTKRTGPLSDLGPGELHVGRKDCTAFVDEVIRHTRVVRAALDAGAWERQVPVHGMLCLLQAEWGFASAMDLRGIWVGWPRLVAGRLHASEVMDSAAVQEVSHLLADRLPPS